MSNALQKITRRAKQIQRAHKNKAWSECIAHASREYNRHKPAVKRKPAAKKVMTKKAMTKKAAPKKRTSARASGQSLAGIRATFCNALQSEYANLAADLVKTTTKRAAAAVKEKMRKVLQEMKRQEALKRELSK